MHCLFEPQTYIFPIWLGTFQLFQEQHLVFVLDPHDTATDWERSPSPRSYQANNLTDLFLGHEENRRRNDIYILYKLVFSHSG